MNHQRERIPLRGADRSSIEASVRHCCEVARRARTQFYLTFFSLPKPLFRDMCVLYAFMRRTDDLGDEPDVPLDQRRERLNAWRGETAGVLDGDPTDDPILPAVADLVRRHRLPSQLLFDVIAGVDSDLTPRRFATFDELERYCYLVAGAVGLCCIGIWKYRDPRAEQAAVACGTAFQLTNILRDVAEDLRQGRRYLPDEDLQRFGVTEAMLAEGGEARPYQELMRFEADRARTYFDRAQPLLEWLSPEGRRVQRAMFGMYGGLLDEIERRRFDVQTGRVRVPRLKKWRIAIRSLLGRG
ncbi:MAG: phytoene/squalene synthase family protein [Planctomyces sp.]|nr:phytoene/squalene synthase family protein [Planctomyces sp.]